MARQEIFVDDLSNEKGAETITYALEGQSYEIDLAPKNAEKLRNALKPFIDASRKSGQPSTKRKRASARKKTDAPAIRAWAAANDIHVSARGAIPQELRERYHAAMAGSSEDGASSE